MKRIAIAFLSVALTGMLAYADDAANTAALTVPNPLTATITADTYAKAGLDLDQGTFGFSNGYDFGFSIAFLNGGTAAKGDQGGVISISNIKLLKWDAVDPSTKGDTGSGTATAPTSFMSIGDIVGKLVIGDLWIQLGDNGGGPDNNINYQSTVANGDGFLDAADTFQYYSGTYGATGNSFTGTNQGGFNPGVEKKGLSFGYTMPKLLGFTGSVASLNDWTSSATQSYEVKAEASLLAVDKLTVIGAYDMSTASGATSAVGAKLGYDLGIVNPVVGFDYSLGGDYSATVNLSAPVTSDIKVLSSVQYKSISSATATNAWVALEVAKPISLKIGAELLGLTGTMTEAVNAQLSVPVSNDLTVWAKTSYDTITSTTGAIYVKAGADLAHLLPLTTFSVEYDSNNFSATTAKLGQLFTTVKVTY